MTYRFLNAGLSMKNNPKGSLISDFQTNLEKEFYVSSDWFTIQKEYPYGSEEYIDTDVRINTLFEAKTATAVGDDFKKLLFKNPSEAPALGQFFQFDNNYWIVSNIENIKNIASSCVIRRCNNLLRWKDFDTGIIYSQPCVIDYLIKETRDYSTGGASLVQPSGFMEIFSQFNIRTNKIRPNRRFIFGNPNNWNAYKIMGGGVNNHNNLFTSDMNSVGLLRLSLLANQVNEDTDDLVNGVADSGEYAYTLSLNVSTLSMAIGDSYVVIPTVELNGTIISKAVTWSSSKTTVATISSGGVITPVGVGTSTITCSLTDNSSITSTCSLTITATPTSNYSILISPSVDYIYETEEQVFTTTLYLNGIAQPDTFTYTLNSNGVPSSNYQYNILSGNTFWVRNIKRYDQAPLIFTATSGATSIQIPIKLKGAW